MTFLVHCLGTEWGKSTDQAVKNKHMRPDSIIMKEWLETGT